MPEDNKELSLIKLQEELGKDKIEDKENFIALLKDYSAQLKQTQRDFLKYLEWAYEKTGRDKEIENMLAEIAGKNASELMESLRKLGFALRDSLGEVFEKSAYRLLEQTRAGKRSDVMYGITRIFMAKNRTLPGALADAFKPYYSSELFKCFIFTFLGSVIKEKNNN